MFLLRWVGFVLGRLSAANIRLLERMGNAILEGAIAGEKITHPPVPEE